jgi:hypothetical protein
VPSSDPDAAPDTLTVVVPTCHGWPAVRPYLARLQDQAVATSTEVIVADGSRQPAPPADAVWPGLVWLRHPGAGLFELRMLARRRARGSIVAVTEDHCMVAPDWCAEILETFRRQPAAVAVKGAVRNGTAARLADHASFLVNHASNLPPFDGGAEDAIFGISAVAYRRSALDRLAPEPGWPVELHDTRRWRAAGETVVADARIQVDHYQSGGLLELSALHFHNARAISGLRRRRMARRDWARIAVTPILPLVRTVRTVTLCARKRVPWATLVPSLPLFVWFYLWKAAGELTGYLTGPGDSATKL